MSLHWRRQEQQRRSRLGKRPFLEMAAGFICGIFIAVYGKPWMIVPGCIGILLWTAILAGYSLGRPENDRYPAWKRRCCVGVLCAAFFSLELVVLNVIRLRTAKAD